MKINISKSELLKAIEIAIKATSSRSTLDSLSGILINAKDGDIDFFATDFITEIKTSAFGIIEEPGSVAVPARIFHDIVRSLPEAAVIIESNDGGITIDCNQANFNIRSLNTSDFVNFPPLDGIQSVELPVNILNEMVKKVVKAASRDESKPLMTGVYTKIEGSDLTMISTDGYRLAQVEHKSEFESDQKFEAVIPSKSLDEVIKMAPSNGSITITISSNQVKFEFDKTIYITQRFEGNYPDYKRMFPDSYKSKLSIDKNELSDAIKRISLMSRDNTALLFETNFSEQSLKISSKSQGEGSAVETILIKIEGEEDMNISFNYRYIQDGLSVIDTDVVTFELVGLTKPGVLRAEEENFAYLVMPLTSSR